MKRLEMYALPDGRVPFREWLEALRDQKAVARVKTRLDRLVLGNPGNVRPIGAGLSELRIDWGPGYRVYFGQSGDVVVILLCGGDKRTQKADIRLAQDYWNEFNRRSRNV